MSGVGRLLGSDAFYKFRRTPVAAVSALIVCVCLVAALFAGQLAPSDPLDAAQFSLADSLMPPSLAAGGEPGHWLGTDDQGRDLLSAIIYGLRISVLVGLSATAFAAAAGSLAGLIAGYYGGVLDAVLMRLVDVQSTFPALLIALLVDGVLRTVLPRSQQEGIALFVVIFAIGISRWPQFARTVRASTMVERGRDYVQAARMIGVSGPRIVLSHVLPNAVSPALVIATINMGMAILDEATLSFLGVGLPANQPSLGTLIHTGSTFLYSGEWWVAFFPGAALAVMVLAVNLLGDWLRDALDPRAG